MDLLMLFWSFFQIGLFSIGGGYAALPLIKNQIVDINGWLSLDGFADLVTITEMTPGPIIINSATFVGMQVAGFPGALASTLGCVTSPCIIVSIIAYFYFKYKELPVVKSVLAMLRPAVVALITSAGISIIVLAIWGEHGFSLNPGNINFISVVLYAAAVLVIRKFKLNHILVIICCGVIGGVVHAFS